MTTTITRPPTTSQPQPAPSPPIALLPERLGRRTHLLVLVGYTLLTFLMTLPIGLELFERVPGGGDAWQNIWNLWWVKQALLVEHSNPYFTDLLYYPDGVTLYFHTLVLTAGIISIPLQLLGLNLIATYNIILLLTFVLAGYGTFLLCHYLTKHRWASFVGGIVFTFSPYHFAHLFGHMNLASLQWIPFYVLLLLRAVDAPTHIMEDNNSSPRHSKIKSERSALLLAAGAGALLAVNAYTDWTYAVFLVIFTGLLFIWKVAWPRERLAFREKGIGPSQAGARLLVGVSTFLLLTAPVLLPMLAEARKGYAQQPPLEVLVYSSDAALAFVPSELHPLWGAAVKSRVEMTGPYLPMKNPSERVVFLGYTVLGLAGWGAWRLRRDRRVLFWGFTVLATWVLSLGPVLQVLGTVKWTAFEVQVPMPYLLLYKLPFLNIMRTPARLSVLTMLALAVLVAFSLAAFLQRREAEATRRRSLFTTRLLAFAFPLLILFEFLPVPFPTVPPGWNVPIYREIAQEPGRFALLELPLRPFGDYMAYQTIHGKPIIGGYIARQPAYPQLESVPVLNYLRDETPLNSALQEQVRSGAGARQLREMGVRYVIIRWWAFTEENRVGIKRKLDLVLGRPPDYSYPGDLVDVWRLDP